MRWWLSYQLSFKAHFFPKPLLSVAERESPSAKSRTQHLGGCRIAIRSSSITVKRWFMTELTRQMTREEARPSGVAQRAPVGNKTTYTCRGHGAETTKVVRSKKNPTHSRIFRDSPPARLPSFCHAIVISFTSVWKGPGTFRLPLTWQMTNKSTVNLWPAGGMYVRQRADASVIRVMVDGWDPEN